MEMTVDKQEKSYMHNNVLYLVFASVDGENFATCRIYGTFLKVNK